MPGPGILFISLWHLEEELLPSYMRQSSLKPFIYACVYIFGSFCVA